MLRNVTETDNYNNSNLLVAEEHQLMYTGDATPLSEIKGWESGGNPNSAGLSRAVSSVVQSTRVGGVTFVKNRPIQETKPSEPESTTNKLSL